MALEPFRRLFSFAVFLQGNGESDRNLSTTNFLGTPPSPRLSLTCPRHRSAIRANDRLTVNEVARSLLLIWFPFLEESGFLQTIYNCLTRNPPKLGKLVAFASQVRWKGKRNAQSGPKTVWRSARNHHALAYAHGQRAGGQHSDLALVVSSGGE